MEPSDFWPLCEDMLRSGRRVRIPAGGMSMFPRVRDGDIVIIEPVAPAALAIGDIVVYRGSEAVVAHRLIGRCHRDGRMQLTVKGDFLRRSDGPVLPEAVLGRVVAVERANRTMGPDELRATKLDQLLTGLRLRGGGLVRLARRAGRAMRKLLRRRPRSGSP